MNRVHPARGLFTSTSKPEKNAQIYYLLQSDTGKTLKVRRFRFALVNYSNAEYKEEDM